MLNYGHLRYFWAVAHEGGLNRAAARLNVSQSALSVQIAALEESLGQKLFERRGRSLVLTEAGRIALEHADSIFAAGDELVSTLKGRTPQSRSALRIGAVTTLSRNFQLSFLQPVVRRGDIEVIVRSGNFRGLLAMLEGMELDVVLANAPPPRDGGALWLAHPIADQPVSLVGKPGVAPAGADVLDLIARHPLVLPGPESSVRAGFEAWAARAGVTFEIAAEIDDMALLRLMMREGVGLGVAPPIVVRDELDAETLTELHRFPDLHETFYAITLKRRYPNPLVAELLAAAGPPP